MSKTLTPPTQRAQQALHNACRIAAEAKQASAFCPAIGASKLELARKWMRDYRWFSELARYNR